MTRTISENGTCSTCGRYCRCKIIQGERPALTVCPTANRKD